MISETIAERESVSHVDSPISTEDEVLIRVKNVRKVFCTDLKRSLIYGLKDSVADLNPFADKTSKSESRELRTGEFYANDHVSFEVRRGECIGLIGHNGAGKTTLLKMLNGLIKPDQGSIEMRGRVGALIALGGGFNPILTGRENIYVNGSILGLSRAEIDSKIDEVIDFSEIRDSIDSPLQNYSSGMQVRLGFAIATAMNPDILILDEVLAVGDAAFRSKCFKRIGDILSRAAVIFVSHSEAQISRICNRVILLEAGKVIHIGNTVEGLKIYRDRQKSIKPESQIVKCEAVRGHEILGLEKRVEWGSLLHFLLRIDIDSDEPLLSDHILIHFSKDSDFILHGEIRQDSAKGIYLEKGRNTLEFSIGPIMLVHGSYEISLSMFFNGGKDTLIQHLYFDEIQMEGPVGSGPSNLVSMSMKSNN